MNVFMLHDQAGSSAPGGMARLLYRGGYVAQTLLTAQVERFMSETPGPPQVILDQEPETIIDSQVLNIKVCGGDHIALDLPDSFGSHDWVRLIDLAIVPRVDREWLKQTLTHVGADVVCVTVDSSLQALQEGLRVDSHGEVAGFYRRYEDLMCPDHVSGQWPHLVFIAAHCANDAKVLQLPKDFSGFMSWCRERNFSMKFWRMAGSYIDLQSDQGLVDFLRFALPAQLPSGLGHDGACTPVGSQANHPSGVRRWGDVFCRDSVQVEDGALLVGPILLGERVKIGRDAVVRASIIAEGVTVPDGALVEHAVVIDNQHDWSAAGTVEARQRRAQDSIHFESVRQRGRYRRWPQFSYPHFWKRLGDILGAALVLILFAPIFPLVALAVKLSSPGPIFFRDRRQGLLGKNFDCLKFRTMVCGADKIQDRLRRANQVDGHHFKIEDDPRVTPIGYFLRETCIDEIPQFINVLLGQMSIVGPRPSPEKENGLCAYWRDARLSVRPGITGLWQVERTRIEGQDFQEWISFDTQYVREMSFRKDLAICRRTAIMLFTRFFHQF